MLRELDMNEMGMISGGQLSGIENPTIWGDGIGSAYEMFEQAMLQNLDHDIGNMMEMIVADLESQGYAGTSVESFDASGGVCYTPGEEFGHLWINYLNYLGGDRSEQQGLRNAYILMDARNEVRGCSGIEHGRMP